MDINTLSSETNRLMAVLSKPPSALLTRFVNDGIVQDILLHWDEAMSKLEMAALLFESDPDNKGALAEIKRTLHTIKGDAAMIGLPAVSEVFHDVESLAESFLEEGVCPTDLLLNVKDWLQRVLDVIASGKMCDHPGTAVAVPLTCVGAGQDRIPRKEIRMKVLIVEDDFSSRLLMQGLLEAYGQCHIAINGTEAVLAFRMALEAGQPYDLICLDIMMPEKDGHAALREMRALEEAKGIVSTHGAKIVMTTALNDIKNVAGAYNELCDGYLCKPVDKAKLIGLLEELKVLKRSDP